VERASSGRDRSASFGSLKPMKVLIVLIVIVVVVLALRYSRRGR
jgi:hypothetical protein